MAILFRVSGLSPGFGLGDHHVFRICPRTLAGIEPGVGTDITGFADDNMYSGSVRRTRMVSNFAIYPRHRFALVNIDPQPKIVRSTQDEIAQGSRNSDGLTDLHFFFGSPQEIYQQYLTVRRDARYAVPVPKYDFFGVGWEAFGALGWKTSANTVEQDVDKYLSDDSKISSGFQLRENL
jgi:hypothetical protein